MQQTQAVFGELAHYGSEPFKCTTAYSILYAVVHLKLFGYCTQRQHCDRGWTANKWWCCQHFNPVQLSVLCANVDMQYCVSHYKVIVPFSDLLVLMYYAILEIKC